MMSKIRHSITSNVISCKSSKDYGTPLVKLVLDYSLRSCDPFGSIIMKAVEFEFWNLMHFT